MFGPSFARTGIYGHFDPTMGGGSSNASFSMGMPSGGMMSGGAAVPSWVSQRLQQGLAGAPQNPNGPGPVNFTPQIMPPGMFGGGGGGGVAGPTPPQANTMPMPAPQTPPPGAATQPQTQAQPTPQFNPVAAQIALRNQLSGRDQNANGISMMGGFNMMNRNR